MITVVSRSKFPLALLVCARFYILKISMPWQKLGFFSFGPSSRLPWKPQAPRVLFHSLHHFFWCGYSVLSEVLSELGQLCLHGPILSFHSLFSEQSLLYSATVQVFLYISLWIDLPIAIVDVDIYGYSCNRLVLLLRLSSFFLSVESLSGL